MLRTEKLNQERHCSSHRLEKSDSGSQEFGAGRGPERDPGQCPRSALAGTEARDGI